ncbi:hypothetical protein M9434_004635 [Picochlorum sp. BPE23]|nr:hypothetical protein M9435_002723 [Picochlorum sp. BPE23]KAI8111062.1 hypothetical protein M9434_004635 [Picochlorum sp. BPE23]
MISSGKAVILALFLAVCIQAVEVYDGETFLDETKYTIEQNEDSIQIFENDLPGIDFVGGRSLLAEEEDCRVPKKEKQCREPRAPSSKSPPPPPPKEEEPYEAPPIEYPSPPPPVYEAYEAPPIEYPPPVVAAPPPPPRDDMCNYTPRRKILSGPRLVPDGGLRACTGLHLSSRESCCEVCKLTAGCTGWMYSRPLDCRTFGYTTPQSVCYLLSEVTGSYDPALPFEYYSGTASY